MYLKTSVTIFEYATMSVHIEVVRQKQDCIEECSL